jgi:hypothetical protein
MRMTLNPYPDQPQQKEVKVPEGPKHTFFPAEADVPDWLLAVEPVGTDSFMQSIKFKYPVDVFETENCFYVFPRGVGAIPVLIQTTAHNCRTLAAGKNVYVATGTLVIMGDMFERSMVPKPLGWTELSAKKKFEINFFSVADLFFVGMIMVGFLGLFLGLPHHS